MKLAYVDCVELIIVDVPAFLHLLHFSSSFCLVKLRLFCIRYLFLESRLRLSAPSFIPKWTLLWVLLDGCLYLSPCVFLPLTHLKLQIRSVGTCVGVSLHGSFITKYSLAIKGNGAAKVRDPEYGAFPAWMSCRKQTSLFSHYSLHQGYTSKASWCWRMDVRRADGGYVTTELEVLLCRRGCEVVLPPLLCPHGSPYSLSLCQQLLITPHRGVGHAWVSFGPPSMLSSAPALT